MDGTWRPRAGFSMVEAIVAVVIVSIGVLAMATATGYIFNEVRFSSRETERTLAVQTAVEELRSLPFNQVQDRAAADARVIHGYRIWWRAEQVGSNLKRVTLISEGPGYVAGGDWSAADQDTFAISIMEP